MEATSLDTPALPLHDTTISKSGVRLYHQTLTRAPTTHSSRRGYRSDSTSISSPASARYPSQLRHTAVRYPSSPNPSPSHARNFAAAFRTRRSSETSTRAQRVATSSAKPTRRPGYSPGHRAKLSHRSGRSRCPTVACAIPTRGCRLCGRTAPARDGRHRGALRGR